MPCSSENDVPALEMANATSAGTGEDHDREGRKDYTDKSDPIREHDCIWCMACVSVCPPQAIKVDQSNLQFHDYFTKKQLELSMKPYQKVVRHHMLLLAINP